jgi:hypothetical protein
MTTFFEANQVRLMLKMKLSIYGWYKDSCVIVSDDMSEYAVLVGVSRIDNKIRKIVTPRVRNVTIKLKVD